MFNFCQTTARIAAWNLQGFGGITEERLQKQVEGLALLDAEVVTLVEINPPDTLDKLIQGLNDKGLCYKSKLLPQTSELHIGVIYKQGITAENSRLLDGSDLDDPAKRKAFIVDMTVGKFDFTLIAVHLKSGRGANEQLIRDEQAKVIGQFIKEQRDLSREDILLMGDFNMIPGQDVSNFHFLGGSHLVDDGKDLIDFLSSWDLQARFSHILPKGRANLLDGFAISRTFSKEYIRGSLQLYPMHWTMDMGRESFRNEVSDHLPFVASFRIDRER